MYLYILWVTSSFVQSSWNLSVLANDDVTPRIDPRNSLICNDQTGLLYHWPIMNMMMRAAIRSPLGCHVAAPCHLYSARDVIK